MNKVLKWLVVGVLIFGAGLAVGFQLAGAPPVDQAESAAKWVAPVAHREDCPVGRCPACLPLSSVGQSAAFDAAVSERSEPTPRTAPRAEFAPSTVQSPRSAQRVVIEAHNTCDEPLTIAWVDFEGREGRADVVLPGRVWTQFSSAGHIFRVRAADRASTFVRDFVTPATRAVRMQLCEEQGREAFAFEAVDAGSTPVVPSCNVPFAAEPQRRVSQTLQPARISVVFRNTCRSTPIALWWVQYDGGLRFTGNLAAGEQQDHTTFVGHEFRITDAMTQRWVADFVIDGGSPVDFCPCSL